MNFVADLPMDEWILDVAYPDVGATISPENAKLLAEQVAYQGLGYVSPNPLVGAVIVDRHHRFVSAGAHLRCGGAHAEVHAIEAALALDTDSLNGACVYATLEPCSHQGRTPACAERLSQFPIRRVVVGLEDPNPLVQGRGIAHLSKCGIEVAIDESWRSRCRKLAEIFLTNIEKNRPFVALKAAVSVNGAIAIKGDQRRQLTSSRAVQYGHFLRSMYDGIAVGRVTAQLDAPNLDARMALGVQRSPMRVVVDPSGKALQQALSNGESLVQDHQRTIWVVSESGYKEIATWPMSSSLKSELKTISLPKSDNGGQLKAVDILRGLRDLNIHSVLLEGGAGLYQSFLKENLVDRIYLFQAPKILLGDGLVHWATHAKGLRSANLTNVKLTSLEPDWLIEATLDSRH